MWITNQCLEKAVAPGWEGRPGHQGCVKLRFVTLMHQNMKSGDVRGDGIGVGRKGGIFCAARHLWDFWTFSPTPLVLSPRRTAFE